MNKHDIQSNKEKNQRSDLPLNGHSEIQDVPGVLNKPVSQFNHPCSIVLSGPSQSGKTYLTQKIICDDWITPTPQRIIWCYGQYQSLYEDLKRRLPHIEFVKGIPDHIEQDTYLDTSIRNCIILDDLMGDAKKDERIANLFTKGSHHRNLSVLYLTQNLFPQGKACRDISLNTKYLILFNNPVDRFQVMTLARRIYPTHAHHFMKIYEEATSHPYGHMLVDLRANTPEDERLRPNPFLGGKLIRAEYPCGEPIKAEERPCWPNRPPGQPCCEESSDSSSESDLDLDMPICNDCGLVFGDASALQDHVKEWCRGRKRKLEYEEEPDPKRRALDTPDDSVKLVNMDKDIYFHWTNPKIKREWEDKVEEKAEEEDVSRNKAINMLLPEIRKSARHVVTELLIDVMKMKQDVFYQSMMKTAESLVKHNSLDMESAIRQAVKLYKHHINELFMPARDEDDDEEYNSDDDDEEEYNSDDEDEEEYNSDDEEDGENDSDKVTATGVWP